MCSLVNLPVSCPHPVIPAESIIHPSPSPNHHRHRAPGRGRADLPLPARPWRIQAARGSDVHSLHARMSDPGDLEPQHGTPPSLSRWSRSATGRTDIQETISDPRGGTIAQRTAPIVRSSAAPRRYPSGRRPLPRRGRLGSSDISAADIAYPFHGMPPSARACRAVVPEERGLA